MIKATNKKIYTTTDYGLFKFVDGNRDVKNSNIAGIMESIGNIGWHTQPILVNEKYEIINGQHRFKALQNLGLPIEFVVDEGLTIEACPELNKSQANWTMNDFVDRYASFNIDDYIWLKTMMERYKELTKSVAYGVAVNPLVANTTTPSHGINDVVKNGEFIKSEKDRIETEARLFYLTRFTDVVKCIGGHAKPFYSAVLFLYGIESIDNERLCKTLNNNRYEIVSCSNVESFIANFEEIYNKGLSKARKIDFTHEYKIA